MPMSEQRWRADVNLRRCEALDEDHSATAERTLPRNDRYRTASNGCGGRSWGRCAEQREAQWEESRAAPVRQKTEVPDADEAAREEMEQERLRNSSTGKAMRRFLFLWAESRQRKVT